MAETAIPKSARLTHACAAMFRFSAPQLGT
jgi:hypothetical protein